MGFAFKLSDWELPVSPAFIRFLDNASSGRERESEAWPDQLSERVTRESVEEPQLITEAADRVMRDAVGREGVARAYALLASLLSGDVDCLTEFHSRFHFISVVGIPRTGGSYLTAELYRSIGLNPYRVPGAIAHDSFPEARPFELTQGSNSWIATLKTVAEYLTMVEFYFADRIKHSDKIVVPKKLTQGTYAAGLFTRAFGPKSEFVITVRHPVPTCISMYEKSGGLPLDGLSRARSNIERCCRRDLQQAGWDAREIATMGYFDAYLRYWELYYASLAATGLLRSPQARIVSYTADGMQSLSRQYQERYASGKQVRSFQIFDKAKRRHPDWVELARPAVERVCSAWANVGCMFPIDDIERCD